MISVKVSDLQEKLNELLNDGVEYVDVTILDSEVFDGEVLPASLHFESYDGDGGGTNYECIEEVKVDPFYRLK